MQQLFIYNSLSRKKELFEPLVPDHAGMYVCGPTVYGDPHLGHARPAVTFDLVFRYLQHIGYKVRYVRNITDVGHLEGDADAGDDKIGKKARLEQLEPMEVVQYYTNRYHELMARLNLLNPSIEPHASGHIIEQIAMVQKILDAGFAYERNGSVYFDIEKYNQKHPYGILSGRKVDELLAFTRELEGQEEKKGSFDFALWKKATPEHLMHWPSPWSEGYPGWHLECSVMGCKYLGEIFDIHGGGMDLLFPHHESEIAQSMAATGKMPVRYWMHNNMITINGQKMGKSLGNAVSLEEFFNGNNPILEKAYSPMTIRFFILQAHYRGTLDFSNEALQAAEKGLRRLLAALATVSGQRSAVSGQQSAVSGQQSPNSGTRNPEPGTVSKPVSDFVEACYAALNDDFNSPVVIAQLFEAARIINLVKEGKAKLPENELAVLGNAYRTFMVDILGLVPEEQSGQKDEIIAGLMDTIIDIRADVRARKDFATSDLIRDKLLKINIQIKDGKEGATWEIKEEG
ncbi:MAG: cysteine--tRNA ligase [Bacteroidales bacterium]|jgi:cysteinyl-tRNA synthetase|nr:cysteine--tRNA ligase [Bacteroidales bacterium]